MSVLEVRRLALPVALAAAFTVLPVVSAQVAPPRDRAAYAPAVDRDWTDEIPAHLWAVEGIVFIEREGRADAAEENLALMAGDVLRTERGRAEILFEDGSALDIDEFSRVDLLSESLVRLNDGRIRLTLARAAETFDYRIDTAAGSVLMRTAGDYRLALSARRGAPELQVTVLRGQADLVNSFGRTVLRTGTESVADEGRAPSAAYGINSALGDSFDRWVATMRAERLGTTSSQYLPSDLRVYGGAFDRYGSWDYLPNYGGYVWYPRVSIGWRPYSVGRWSSYGNFGWFWVGADRWSWPTHHYGRWGLSANRWYWVPDRRWAPAWVAWGGAPGYTSWCPLGFDGRPVVAFSSVRYADPWTAWTVVPTRVFANNLVVSQHVVNYRGIAPNVRSQFEVRRAPVGGAYSSTRVQPLRAPTMGRALSRDGVRSGTDFATSPVSRSIDTPLDRVVAPSIDQSAARARSRIPARAENGGPPSPSLEVPLASKHAAAAARSARGALGAIQSARTDAQPRNRRRPVGGTGERAAIHPELELSIAGTTADIKRRAAVAHVPIARRRRFLVGPAARAQVIDPESAGGAERGAVRVRPRGPGRPGPGGAQSPARLSADVTDRTGHPRRRQSRIVKSGRRAGRSPRRRCLTV